MRDALGNNAVGEKVPREGLLSENNAIIKKKNNDNELFVFINLC